MKHLLFERICSDYPQAIEDKYDRILTRIEQLWDKPEIHDYFSDLIIDKRGGRQGFPKDVLDEILMLRDLRESETFRLEREKEQAHLEFGKRGVPKTTEEFIKAVGNGDQALVDLFIRVGINIHAAAEDGTPLLILALKKGYTVIAHILIQAGADVNCYDKMGMTPLLLACGKKTHGFTAIAEELIRRGAFVNDRDRLGNTPLLLCLSGGTIEVAELLIEKKADVNARTKDGQTPLSMAKASNNLRLAEVLLSSGAKD